MENNKKESLCKGCGQVHGDGFTVEVEVINPTEVSRRAGDWLQEFMVKNPEFFAGVMKTSLDPIQANKMSDEIGVIAKKFLLGEKVTTEELLAFCWVLRDSYVRINSMSKEEKVFATNAMKKLQDEVEKKKGNVKSNWFNK